MSLNLIISFKNNSWEEQIILAQFRAPKIKPRFQHAPFIEKLQEFQFSSSDHSVSFDVSSLYTNVPLGETIELIAKK